MLSTTGSNAAVWLRALDIPMTPSDFVLCLRLRCGLDLKSAPTHCSCGKEAPEPLHLVCCPSNEGVTAKHRHDAVLRGMSKVLHEFNIAHIVEPCYFDARLRPDIAIQCGESTAPVTDFTVVNPCGSSAIAAGSHETRGCTAQNAAAQKSSKYSAIVQRKGGVFHPCAMEVLGHMHRECLTFAHKCSLELPVQQRREFKRRLLTTMATVTQQGNARIIKHLVVNANTKMHGTGF